MNFQATSHEAYESVKPALPKLETLVIKELLMSGPMTCEELEFALQRSHQTVSSRITHLKGEGVIKDSGNRGVTLTGRKAIKWEISNVKKAAQKTIETPQQLALAFQ